jgi:hypothetical protein
MMGIILPINVGVDNNLFKNKRFFDFEKVILSNIGYTHPLLINFL